MKYAFLIVAFLFSICSWVHSQEAPKGADDVLTIAEFEAKLKKKDIEGLVGKRVNLKILVEKSQFEKQSGAELLKINASYFSKASKGSPPAYSGNLDFLVPANQGWKFDNKKTVSITGKIMAIRFKEQKKDKKPSNTSVFWMTLEFISAE